MLLLYRGDNFDANFFHHAGVDIDHSFLIEGGKKRVLLTSGMNEAIARRQFRGRVVVYRDALEALSRVIRRRTVSYDASSMSARLASRIGKGCRLKDCSQELLMARSRKRPDEAAKIKRAVKLTKDIFDSLDFRKAKTELDIHAQLMKQTFEMGLEPAFEPIVSTGASTSFPHYRAGKKRLGSLVLVDYGVRCGHYCADLTRCFILDGDRKKMEQYGKLQDICWFLADSLPQLRTGKEVAKLAAELMARGGFPKMVHSIGHGVGLDVHEFPRLSERFSDPLAGAVVAIEPAFYLERYGMRFEETVWFDGRKSRIL